MRGILPLRGAESEVNVTGVGLLQRSEPAGLPRSSMTFNYFWQDKHQMALPLGAGNKGQRSGGINCLKRDTIFNLAALEGLGFAGLLA